MGWVRTTATTTGTTKAPAAYRTKPYHTTITTITAITISSPVSTRAGCTGVEVVGVGLAAATPTALIVIGIITGSTTFPTEKGGVEGLCERVSWRRVRGCVGKVYQRVVVRCVRVCW